MSNNYFEPNSIVENGSELIEIPYSQQRQLADRKFFSLRINGSVVLDMDVDMINNKRPVLTLLAQLLHIRHIGKIKKPELAAQIQARFRFLEENQKN